MDQSGRTSETLIATDTLRRHHRRLPGRMTPRADDRRCTCPSIGRGFKAFTAALANIRAIQLLP